MSDPKILIAIDNALKEFWDKHKQRITEIIVKVPDDFPSYFPALVRMVDTGEEFIAQTMEDIPCGRDFNVLKLKVKQEKA